MTGARATRPDLTHDVQMADGAVRLVCDPRLRTLHTRLRNLFDTSVDAVPARRRVRIEVQVDADGLLWVSADDVAVAARDETDAVMHVLSAVNAEVLPASTLLTIHAGAVRASSGVIAWPAQSGAGKSTLVAAALQRGYALVSDEALCLDTATATATVVPYPKPVSLDAWAVSRLGLGPSVTTASLSGEFALSAGDLDATAATSALPLAAVVLICRGEPSTLERLGTDRAAAALLRHSFNHWRMPEAAVTTVHTVLQTAEVYGLTYDDPVAAAQLLVDALPPPSSRTASK